MSDTKEHETIFQVEAVLSDHVQRQSTRNATQTERGAAYELDRYQEKLGKLAKRVQKTILAITNAVNAGSSSEVQVESRRLKDLATEVSVIQERIQNQENAADLASFATDILQAVTSGQLSATQLSNVEEMVVSDALNLDKISRPCEDGNMIAEITLHHPITPSAIMRDTNVLQGNIVVERSMVRHSDTTGRDIENSDIGSVATRLGDVVQGQYSRLRMQMDLIPMVLSNNNETAINRESNNLDHMLHELSDANNKYLEVLNDTQRSAQADWMYSVDKEVFQLKQQICSWEVEWNKIERASRCSKDSHRVKSKSSSSSGSRKSRNSSHSGSSTSSAAVLQKARTEELKTEAVHTEKTLDENVQAEGRQILSDTPKLDKKKMLSMNENVNVEVAPLHPITTLVAERDTSVPQANIVAAISKEPVPEGSMLRHSHNGSRDIANFSIGSVTLALEDLVQSQYSRLRMQMELIPLVLSSNNEAAIERESNNLDQMLHELVDVNNRFLELLNDTQRSVQADWMYSVDEEVFRLKQQICSWQVEWNKSERASRCSKGSSKDSHRVKSKSSSSSGSRKSRNSSHSGSSTSSAAVLQKARTEELKTEAAYIEKTFNEKIQAEARRKEEEMKSKLAKLNLEIAKSEARERILDAGQTRSQMERSKKDHTSIAVVPVVSLGADVVPVSEGCANPLRERLPVVISKFLAEPVGELPFVTSPFAKRPLSMSLPVTSGASIVSMVEAGASQSVQTPTVVTSTVMSRQVGELPFVTSPVAMSPLVTPPVMTSPPVNYNNMTDVVRMLKAPTIDIESFDGSNALEFEYFLSTFKDAVESTVEDQRGRLLCLLKYTKGKANDLIKHCIRNKIAGYDDALQLLIGKYGEPDDVTEKYLRELRKWPTIKQNDAGGLDHLHRFLLQCNTHKQNGYLSELNFTTSIRLVILKLHHSYQEKWNSVADKIKRKEQRRATFQDLINFVEIQASLASNPYYSADAMSEAKVKENIKSHGIRHVSFLDGMEKGCEDEPPICTICSAATHDPDICPSLLSKDLPKRKELIRKKKLCFACLLPISNSHIAKSCTSKKICLSCKGIHPTSLHNPAAEKKSVISGAIRKPIGSSVISLCVVPVYVCHKSEPSKSLRCYAMLDDGSTGCFAKKSLLEKLAPEHLRKASLSVETLNGVHEWDTTAINDLMVRCADKQEKKHSQNWISLPITYSTDHIPIGKDEIPTPRSIEHWEYLKPVSEVLSEIDEHLPYGLIIGGNCPKALQPLQTIESQLDGPYAFRTHLGWCVCGPIATYEEEGSRVKCNHTRILTSSTHDNDMTKIIEKKCFTVKDAVTNTTAPHHFTTTISIKDQYITRQLQHMYEVEFNEKDSEKKANSKEDDTFLDTMKMEIWRDEDNHYVLPLPFRGNSTSLQNNRKQAFRRLMAVKGKMLRDKEYKDQYIEFIKKLLNKGYARKCPLTSPPNETDNVWYLCHFGVSQPPKKLRVVMDCSAKFEGRCLNDELLQGPDLTNNLLGVLLRFRRENIAFTADVEGMFLQVRVPEEHQKFLRFLWWPDSDLSKRPEDFEMLVHVFGANCSPSIANFALRQTAVDNRETLGDEAADVLMKDFYVDDMLKSVPTSLEAITLIPQIKRMCQEGGFNLTKFLSNSPDVIISIPPEDRRPSIQQFELVKKLPVERALGVTWCVESDTLQFRITLDSRSLTRRGMLSTVSSIYDVFGLASPFLLRGRKILQELSSEKKSWDDPVSTNHAMQWDAWTRELPLLEKLHISRCFKSDEFGESIDTQLHNFSDAAQQPGYGEASYIRQVNKDGKVEVCLIMGKSRVTPSKLSQSQG